MEWVPVLSALATLANLSYISFILYFKSMYINTFPYLYHFIYKKIVKLTYATKAPRLATVGKNTSNFTMIKRFRDFNHCPTTDSSKISSNRGWKKLNRIFPVIFRDVSCRAEWWRRPTNSAAQSGWGSFEAAESVSWGCWRLPTRRSAHCTTMAGFIKFCPLNLLFDC